MKSILTGCQSYLRPLEPEDVDLLYAIENDSENWDVGDTVAPYSRDILLRYATTYEPDPYISGQCRLVIADLDDNSPVGMLDFFEISRYNSHAKLGIYILEPWRRQGYASDAIEIAKLFASKSLCLKQLLVEITFDNLNSLGLFKKNGFLPVGRLFNWHRDKDVELLQYSL
ncbi:MAG: GNAT family N-acetyltransferase [Prevotella sp.]|nr:GNAT family N-acetyltransferase [Prevotella sp.]